MRLEINRTEGRRNDLLLRLDRSEVDTARLGVANRARLLALPGMPRHRTAAPDEIRGIADAKMTIEDHLRQLDVIDESGRVVHRAIAISNRNLGTNHGHLAWQRNETPPVVRVLEDPCDQSHYSCLTVRRDGAIAIEDLVFNIASARITRASDGRDVSNEREWATSGPRVLRDGRVPGVEEFAPEFYDARHVLAFDHERASGEQIRAALYRGYPATFGENMRRAWTDEGVPRARYVHNAIGVSDTSIVIVQREGTVEEIGEALAAAGAEDGIILDNGGSVACWAWWVNDYAGGLISPTIDYRPPGTSAIAFMLKGPLHVDLPGGSVSYSTYQRVFHFRIAAPAASGLDEPEKWRATGRRGGRGVGPHPTPVSRRSAAIFQTAWVGSLAVG